MVVFGLQDLRQQFHQVLEAEEEAPVRTLVHHRVLPSLQAPVGGVGEVYQSDIDTLWPVQALPHPGLPRPGRGQAAAQGPLPPGPAGAGRGQGLGGAVPRPPQGGGRAPSQQGQGAGGQAVPDWRPRPLAGTAVIGDQQGGGVEPVGGITQNMYRCVLLHLF